MPWLLEIVPVLDREDNLSLVGQARHYPYSRPGTPLQDCSFAVASLLVVVGSLAIFCKTFEVRSHFNRVHKRFTKFSNWDNAVFGFGQVFLWLVVILSLGYIDHSSDDRSFGGQHQQSRKLRRCSLGQEVVDIIHD
mmetsp:Transcript_22884/g.63661  ORF Transcript_22884/g.63661 Transcript_22884/m.63661 type:complete len:136 (-) Transcript_22884:871-1278(-)